MQRREFLALCLQVPVWANAAPASSCGTSTAEEVTSGLNLSGKTAVITGCNSGIGLETMRVLALRGAQSSAQRERSRKAKKRVRR